MNYHACKCPRLPSCRWASDLQTWEVVCIECGDRKWPMYKEKPENYVCVLCLSGSGAARKIAGKRNSALRGSKNQVREA